MKMMRPFERPYRIVDQTLGKATPLDLWRQIFDKVRTPCFDAGTRINALAHGAFGFREEDTHT